MSRIKNIENVKNLICRNGYTYRKIDYAGRLLQSNLSARQRFHFFFMLILFLARIERNYTYMQDRMKTAFSRRELFIMRRP